MAKNNEIAINKNKNDITKVEVNLPSRIQIDLVQGNELRHYEIFFSFGTFALSTAVGFWTSYIGSSVKSKPSFWSAIAFTALALISGRVAFYYRSKMRNGKVIKTASLDDFSVE